MSTEVKASTAYTICSIIQKGLSFITLPLFTRLLTTEQYGQYTVYASWASIFTIFITMNLAYGTFQTAMLKFRDARDKYSSSIAFLFMALGALFLVIYLPFQNLWNSLLKLPTFIVVFMAVDIVFTGIEDCWYSKNRFEYKYKSVIGLTLGKALISPTVAFILITLTAEKGYARIIGYASVNILAGLVLYLITLKKGKTFYNKEYWKYALSFNIPLIPYYASQMVFNVSDRLMIDHICGTDQAAIYGVAYSLALVLNFIITAINSSYSPWFLRQLDAKEGDKNRKVSLNLASLVAVGLWLIVSIAPEFIAIMAGPDYTTGVWVVPPVAISVLLLFYTQLFDRVLFFYEKKYLLVLSGAIPCVVNLILNYIFIPIFGMVAAAYTTLVSYVLFAGINYFLSLKILKEQGNHHSLYDIKGLIILLVLLCALSALVMALYGQPVIRFVLIAIIVLIAVIKRNTILKMIRMEA